MTGLGPLAYPSGVSVPDSSKRSGSAEPTAPRYAEAGVDLDRDEGFIDEIEEITRPTLRPEILSSVGGFAGLFKAPERYRDPIFVAGADGVGTKLKLAAQIGRFDTVGIDCVAMVVNDLVVQGAEPLVFLDYLAMATLDKKLAAEALRGIAEGCRRAGCALLGGETASMPGVYEEGEIELVLYYNTIMPDFGRTMFQGLFEQFLYQRDVEVTRFPPVVCDKGHLQERRTVVKRIREGKKFLFCEECGDKIDLPDIEQRPAADVQEADWIRREEAMRAIPDVVFQIPQNKIIVREGDLITKEVMSQLEALRQLRKDRWGVLNILGVALLSGKIRRALDDYWSRLKAGELEPTRSEPPEASR